jgi:hypothetical protein
MTPLQRGDFVTVGDVTWMVVLASSNGRSILVMGEGILGGCVGTVPLLLHDDGIWRTLTNVAVDLQRRQGDDG